MSRLATALADSIRRLIIPPHPLEDAWGIAADGTIVDAA
jgi:hypothetical protein